MYPYIDLGFVDYPTYGLLSLLGVIASVSLMLYLLRKRGGDPWCFFSICLWGFIGTLIGARLLYALTRFEDVSHLFSTRHLYSFGEFISTLNDLTSGMVFYGGLYGGILFGYLWARHKKADIPLLSDVFSVGIPVFHIFGRVGCFLAGCCYGVKSDFGFSGRVLTEDIRERATRFPIQLLEAFVLIIIASLLVFLFVKRILRGRLMAVYLLVYAVARFFLEFLRGDEIRGRFLLFSTSQWISILTVILVAVYSVSVLLKRKRKT